MAFSFAVWKPVYDPSLVIEGPPPAACIWGGKDLQELGRKPLKGGGEIYSKEPFNKSRGTKECREI